MQVKSPWWLLPIVLGIVVLILVFGAHVARAQEHRHPPQHQALHEQFYSTWQMPDNRAVSCCHGQDCTPAEARKTADGKWMARREGDTGGFTPIPPQKEEHERDSPDGRSHLCGRGQWGTFTVYCFIAGAGH